MIFFFINTSFCFSALDSSEVAGTSNPITNMTPLKSSPLDVLPSGAITAPPVDSGILKHTPSTAAKSVQFLDTLTAKGI